MVERPVLVVGATGSTGRRVTRRLREAGLPVRPVSRATPVPFDWSQPSTWVAAVNGAAALYLMAPDGTAVDPDFVTYAVGHGVERVVLLSSTNLTEMHDERLLAAEQTVTGVGRGVDGPAPDMVRPELRRGLLPGSGNEWRARHADR